MCVLANHFHKLYICPFFFFFINKFNIYFSKKLIFLLFFFFSKITEQVLIFDNHATTNLSKENYAEISTDELNSKEIQKNDLNTKLQTIFQQKNNKHSSINRLVWYVF